MDICVHACVRTYVFRFIFFIFLFLSRFAFLITLQSAALFQLQSIISIHIFTVETHTRTHTHNVCDTIFFLLSLLFSRWYTHAHTLTHMMRTITYMHRHTFTTEHAKYHGTTDLRDYRCRFLFFFYSFILLFLILFTLCCAVFLLSFVRVCKKKKLYFCVWALRDAMTD